MNKTLDELRKEIDAADEELLNVLAKRAAIVREIGKLKKEQNLQPIDKERWQKVLQNITKKAKSLNLSEEIVKNIYEKIHQYALKIEHE
jgi:chorismate mutase